MTFIIQWIDIIFLPLSLALVKREQRLTTAAFIIGCMVMMRLQAELIVSTGFSSGFLPFLDSDVHTRGQITYSFFYVIYIVLALYSPTAKGAIFMAGAISIFFAALFVSMIIMIL